MRILAVVTYKSVDILFLFKFFIVELEYLKRFVRHALANELSAETMNLKPS